MNYAKALVCTRPPLPSEIPASFLDFLDSSLHNRAIGPDLHLLAYLAERYELADEQRAWLAFLYSTCFKATSAWIMFHAMPWPHLASFFHVRRFWMEHGDKLPFHENCAPVRKKLLWPSMVISYLRVLGERTHGQWFFRESGRIDTKAIEHLSLEASRRWAEALFVLSGRLITTIPAFDPMITDGFFKGIYYVIGKPDSIATPLFDFANQQFLLLRRDIEKSFDGISEFEITRAVIAYGGYRRGLKVVGSAIHRQAHDLKEIEARFPTGVCWRPAHDFRKDRFPRIFLKG